MNSTDGELDPAFTDTYDDFVAFQSESFSQTRWTWRS